MSLVVTKPGGKVVSLEQFQINSDKTFETMIKIGKTFDVDGVYSIKVQYGSENADLVAFEFHQSQDNVPPLLLIPSDMVIEIIDPKNSRVEYSVKAIDDVDGVLESFCTPSSGSMFPIGDTIVTCQDVDDAGNSVQKSFTITISLNPQSVIIPSWIKDVASFWCSDTIDDASFVEAVQYLIENNVIHIPLKINNSDNNSQVIPDGKK